MGTFVEVPLPPRRKAVKSKWVFKKKTLADGSLDKYKARVVAKGFSQRYGEDYTQTFSPVDSLSCYEKLRAYLISLGFQCGKADNFLFIKGADETLMVILNIRPAATPMEEQYRNCLFQEQDLTTFKPRPALGALLYLSVLTRPDISTAVRLLAQETEPFAVERESKSSTGFSIFYDGNLVEWGLKKQGTVTLSSTEAEYIAMATGLHECIGIMLVLKELGIVTKNIVVMEDNQGAQHLAESKGVTQRSRHIDTKYHWLREKVSDGLTILLSL
ncbi:hypothetical protein PsorP6_012192 [Peronosclerospora sorghi]|uniref:Uncharacterized protein n=1 Tax=Peronosclerospora sorghi TaxID=230839 RepID=A0ACC0WJ31_9STRA|nr:hypothetical protein PsorP6_012192 [Peronosclerospora sorghi]